MKQSTFVMLSVIALGLVLLSFVILGFSRFVVTGPTAAKLSAPTMILGGGLIVFLTLRSVLAISGIRPLRE